MRRVVVTGAGMVTPLGVTTDESWHGFVNGRSGVSVVHDLRRPAYRLPVTIAGHLLDFDPTPWMFAKKDAGRYDRFIHLAMCAAAQAWTAAGLPERLGDEEGDHAAAILGVGFGGIGRLLFEYDALLAQGAPRVSAYGVPAVIGNMAPALAAIRYNLRGANWAPSSACASGSHAIGEAFLSIRDGRHDLCVAGGAEAPVASLTAAAFSSARAMSTAHEESPTRASRPFERSRDGFVLGEGAGVLILEERERARRRGAHILAELVGYGATCDAAHVTAPAAEGEGASRAMRAALRMSERSPASIGGILAHGTSTRANDVVETCAIKEVFGPHAKELPISAPKSMIGHSLGAAGAIQAVMAVQMLRERVIPPTINYDEPDPLCDLDYVPNHARPFAGDAVMVNAFGFGGTNAVLVLQNAG